MSSKIIAIKGSPKELKTQRSPQMIVNSFCIGICKMLIHAIRVVVHFNRMVTTGSFSLMMRTRQKNCKTSKNGWVSNREGSCKVKVSQPFGITRYVIPTIASTVLANTTPYSKLHCPVTTRESELKEHSEMMRTLYSAQANCASISSLR